MLTSKIPVLAALVVLAALAALWNLHAPTVFFDSQIMLGGSLAVFALLQFGWPGLLVGLVALGATALRWGHPFELLIGTAFLLWLKVFLDHLNGGWANRDNGRVVLAAAVFWVAAGLPLELLLFNRYFELPVSQALGIGLKESVTGLLNTTLGLLAFLAVRWWISGNRPGTFSVRGLTFAAILAAISIPGFVLTLVLSHQLKSAVLERQLIDLRHYGNRAADLADLGGAGALEIFAREGGNKQFLLRRADGSTLSSDSALFEQLRQNYEIETPSRTGRTDLGIYRPLQDAPVIETDADSYWFATFKRAGNGVADAVTDVTVVETPPEMVRMLDYELLLPSFSILLGLLLGGTLLAAWAGRAADRQFRRVLPATATSPDGAPLPLVRSRIKELDTLVEAVNELELARQQSREELQRILENLPVAVATNTLGSPARTLYLNRQFTHTFGYTLADIPTVADWATLAYPDPDYRREVFREWDAAVARAIRGKGTIESMEFEVAAKDRTRRNVVFHAVVMEDRLLITLTDLTARRRAEAELRSAREELQRAAYELTENIPVGTYTMVQPPGGGLAYFSFMSTRFLELTGLTREKARENPMNAFACVHPDDHDEWVRKNVYAFENRRPFYETCRIRAGGVTRWITAESTPRDLPDGSVVWEGVLTDITARKKAEDELAAARRREKEIEQEMRETLEKKLKTSLNAAAVAHEINQPLSRILLRTQMELENSTGRERETLTLLIEDAQRVVTIIDKMRVLLRNVETPHHPLDLSEVAESALLQVKTIMRRDDIDVHLRTPETPVRIPGDDVQLQIALTNLLQNAAQAIAAAGSTRREIEVEVRAHPDSAELIVGDSGPGWPGGTIDEMLLRTSKPDGTGIGLYIVKTTIDHHHGKIQVGRSKLGGTEFRLTFPTVEEQQS
jgi:PAS domain S-box-containing protein